MPIPLLPRPEGEDEFVQQQPGFFALNVEDVKRRVAPAKHLAPAGIASLAAQVSFFEWRLQRQDEPEGREVARVLRLIVLLQFLDHLRPVHLPLDDVEMGWLGPLVQAAWGEPKPTKLLIWKLADLGGDWDGRVFAGSHPRMPLFPAAPFYPDVASGEDTHFLSWRRVLQAFIEKYSDSQLISDEAEVIDATLAASLVAYLAGFIDASTGAGWGAAFQAWRDQLNVVAAGTHARPIAALDASVELLRTGTPRSVTFGRYPRASQSEMWQCSECSRAGRIWMNLRDRHTMTADRLGVWCRDHPDVAITVNGSPVGPEHCGAYLDLDLSQTDDPKKRVLYVWTDHFARPVGASIVGINGQPGSDGSVEFSINQQTVEIKGRLVSVEQLLLPTVAFMARNDKHEPAPVDVPVAAEHAALVVRADRRRDGWEITFKGIRTPIDVPYPDHHATALWNQSVMVVWPPRRCAGWSLDYVAADTATLQGKRPAFRLVEVTTNGSIAISQVSLTNAIYRTSHGPARYVEVGELDDENSFRSLGLLDLDRKRAEVADQRQGTGRVILDFGTSNSAVLWQVPDRDIPGFVLSGEDRSQRACFLTEDDHYYQDLLRGVDVLAPWNRNDDPPRRFLPSLHAKPDRERKGAEASIPPRGNGLKLLSAVRGREARIISGLKWRDWGASGILERLESLIELLLVPAFWELRLSGCKKVALRATYPLAFGRDRENSYRVSLKKVADALAKSTGLELDGGTVELVSESIAGSRQLPALGVTHVVALDAGGGTTDLAIHAGARADAIAPGTVMVADSLECAGRHLLRATVVSFGTERLSEMFEELFRSIGFRFDLPEVESNGDYDAEEAYVATLEALLHRAGVQGLDDLLRKVPRGRLPDELKRCHQEMLIRWEALLAGLLLYTGRMLDGAIPGTPEGSKPKQQSDGRKEAPREFSAAFNLLGQGWELLRLLGRTVDEPLETILKPRFDAVCAGIAAKRSIALKAEVQPLPAMEDRKTAVVLGASKIDVGRLPAREAAPAWAGDVRRTFIGMDIVNRGQVVYSAATPLEALSQRPGWQGDIGYARLIDDLFETIPQMYPGTSLAFRETIRQRLFKSEALRTRLGFNDVRERMIQLGQNDFEEGGTWPRNQHPTRSLLGGFLSSVWQPIWSSYKL